MAGARKALGTLAVMDLVSGRERLIAHAVAQRQPGVHPKIVLRDDAGFGIRRRDGLWPKVSEKGFIAGRVK